MTRPCAERSGLRIVHRRDPGAHGATAPNPPVAAGATPCGMQARPPIGGGRRRIAHPRDPGAHGATAPNPPVAAHAPVQGAQASRRMPAPAD